MISGAEAADNVAQVTGVPYDFSWAGPGMKRVKQLASPIDVNPPQRVGGVNDLGGEGTVEGNSIRALMQSFFQSTRETPALLTNRPSAVQAMLMMTAPTVVNRVAANVPTGSPAGCRACWRRRKPTASWSRSCSCPACRAGRDPKKWKWRRAS